MAGEVQRGRGGKTGKARSFRFLRAVYAGANSRRRRDVQTRDDPEIRCQAGQPCARWNFCRHGHEGGPAQRLFRAALHGHGRSELLLPGHGQGQMDGAGFAGTRHEVLGKAQAKANGQSCPVYRIFHRGQGQRHGTDPDLAGADFNSGNSQTEKQGQG